MKSPCPRCGYIHPSDAAHVIDRFAAGPATYRARDVPDAPSRPTRFEAEVDWCAHHRHLTGEA